MLDGDLLTNQVEQVLLDLGAQRATGCLTVLDAAAEEAEVYLKEGLVYSVDVPGRRPRLGAALVSMGALAPEARDEALEIQRRELQGWRLGELLIHLGFSDRSAVESVVSEQLVAMLSDLLGWDVDTWRFRKNKKARQDEHKTDILRMADIRIWPTRCEAPLPLRLIEHAPGGRDQQESAADQDEAEDVEWAEMGVQPPTEHHFQKMAGIMREPVNGWEPRLKPTREQIDRQREPIHLGEQCHQEGAVPGYVDYGLNHGAKLMVDIEEGRFVFFYLPVDA